jgi:dTDP-4-amino-4,6-dideoxygalactose transaminase
MREEKIRSLMVGCPNLGNFKKFQELVSGAFDRRWFTNNGELVQLLEKKISDYLDVKHCILVCNATVGLQIAAHELGLKGEVIIPSFTFIATPHSLSWQNIAPKFVDIDPETHLLNIDLIEKAITPNTSGILGVHTWGNACHPIALQEVADRHNIKLYFDAAHAFGCSYQGKKIGSFGSCEVFSFHATKLFNTFEGGAITTNDDLLAVKFRNAINFGFIGLDSVCGLGINGKMSEIHAAMGLACFDELDKIINVNYQNYNYYKKRLMNINGLKIFDYSKSDSNFQYVVIEIIEKIFGSSRDELVNYLHSKFIFARKYFYPGCHRLPPYSTMVENKNMLPATDEVCSRVMILPTGTNILKTDIDRICDEILKFLFKRK